MKFKIKPKSAADFKLSLVGDDSFQASYISTIPDTDITCVTFYRGDDLTMVSSIEAGVLLVNKTFEGKVKEHKSKAVVFCDNPKFEWIKIISNNYTNSFELNAVNPISDNSVKISDTSFIETNVLIGKGSSIYPNTSVFKDSIIGQNCEIQSGTVIGGIGLGDVLHEEVYHKFVHLGKVIIEDNVSIGANVTVLKGMIENTIIGKGTKIGSNVNIGHNVIIGKNCYISSGVTIAGAAIIEDNCWVSVGVVVNDHVRMAKNSKAGTGSVIIKDTLENGFYLGNPARMVSLRKD